MNCEDLRDHYDLYALDIAEEPERGEIRAHLDRGCAVCVAGVKRSLEITALMGAAANEAQPSPKLRRRILASVGVERNAIWWIPLLAVGLAIVILLDIAVGSYRSTGLRHASEEARLQRDLQSRTDQVARLTQAFAIVSGPRTTEVSFGGAQPRPPEGKVFLNPARGVLLIASNLPRTPVDKIYEMWIIPRGAKPVPAGLFQSQEDGSAMHVRPGIVDLASTSAVAVTVENQAGADQPTSTPLIVAAVKAATP
jgi:hypothetical protein